MMHNIVLLLLLTTTLFTTTQQQKQIVNFAFFYPFSSNEISQPEGYNVTEIIDYGIEQFDLLPIATKYELRMQIFDSNCNARDGIRAYIEMLQRTEYFPFIIGPACSIAAEPVALDITFTNILSVSYFAASPQFGNNTLFPNLFRLFPPEEILLNARVNFIKNQGWNRVGIILQSLSVFTSSIRLLQDQLIEEEIESELFLVFDEAAIEEVLDDLFDAQYNILIGLFYPEFANRFLCEFFRRKPVPEIQYVWLLDGWLPLDFYTNNFGCQSENLSDLLDYSIFFTNFFPTNETTPTILGPNFTRFHQQFNSTIIEDDLVFDSFATMVVAIQLYDEMFGADCETDNTCIGDYTYSTPNITDKLRDILYQLTFQGISGNIQFTETGDRNGNVTIQQSFNGVRQEIGFSSGSGDYIFVNAVMWQGGSPPGDGSTVRFSYIYLSQFIVFCILAVVGIISSVVYILVILIKWKHGAINSNTPLLTLTTLIGSIVLYTGTITLQLPNLEDYIINDLPGFAVTCSVVNWMLTIGFTLTYYPLFLKMLNAFYLKEYKVKSTTVRRKRKFQLEEFHLLIILAGCVILDVLFLMIWTAIPQIRFVLTTDMLSTIQNGLPELIIEYNCGAELEINERVIISLVIISRVIVLVVAMVIAFDTRSLKFRQHRENIWVGISLYTVAVLGLVGIVCHQFILRQADLRMGLVVLCMLAAIFATTNLLCVPLIVILVKDRDGTGDYGVELGPKGVLGDQGFTDQRIRALESDNKKLREAAKVRSDSMNKLLGSGEVLPEGRVKSESVL